MALPFLGSSAKRRDQIVAVDLGARQTKAVHLQRKGEQLSLTSYSMVDAPVYDKNLTPEALGDNIKKCLDSLGSHGKQVAIVLGVNDSLVRHAEMPMVPVPDMRSMLKVGAKNYLQQDLPDHLFDCHMLPINPDALKAEPGKSPKCRVIVGGAKREMVENMQKATKHVGLNAVVVTSALVSPVNAFELAMPEIFSKEVVALVDFGYKSSTITILLSGELILSRVVGFGAAKLTTGIAESMGVTTAEAEGIKVGMPQEVESTLQPLLTPLGRELRASIDFFEHQQDKTVSQVFFSGGSARSNYIVEALQAELMVPCKSWNPASGLGLALPPAQTGEIEQVAPQLAVAIGGAVGSF